MAFKKKVNRITKVASSNEVETINNVIPLSFDTMILDFGLKRTYFKRLQYKFCPKVSNTPKNKGVFKNVDELIYMNRDDFVSDMYKLFSTFSLDSQSGHGYFRTLCGYVEYLDFNNIKASIDEENIVSYCNYIKDEYLAGKLSLSVVRIIRTNILKIYRQDNSTAHYSKLKRRIGTLKSREGDKTTPHNTIGDDDLTLVGKMMMNAYKVYADHLLSNTKPVICPFYDEDKLLDLGKREDEINQFKWSSTVRVSAGNWHNNVSKLALLIISMWTGGNLTVLSKLYRSDVEFQKLNGDYYKLKSIKPRAGYKDIQLNIGFTKRTKEFLENWLIVSKEIILDDIDAPLFPVKGRDGEYNLRTGLLRPQKSINESLSMYGLPVITTSVFRKTRSSIMMRAYNDVFLVAKANKSTEETVSKDYLHGVKERHHIDIAAALDVQNKTSKGESKKDAIERVIFKVKDPLTSEEWQKVKNRALNKTMTGFRCGSPKGEMAKKSLRPYRNLKGGDSGFCVDFLGCFECDNHALVADVDDIWLMLSFKDTLLETLERPSFNSAPSENFNKILATVNSILEKFKKIALVNFNYALEKNKSSSHPLYDNDSSIDDLLEIYNQ